MIDISRAGGREVGRRTIQPTRDGARRSTRFRPGDVLIDVRYSSLNYKDGLSATGNPGVTRNFPHTPGIDAAGTVVESASLSSRRAMK